MGYNACSPSTDVSEDLIASIFSAEQEAKQDASEQSSACYLFNAGFLLGLFIDHEDEGDKFL
jgi:hypothetical protein